MDSAQLSLSTLSQWPLDTEFQALRDINLYDSEDCCRLATQAARGRYLRLQPSLLSAQDLSMVRVTEQRAIRVGLVEDDYPGWLSVGDLEGVVVAECPYQPVVMDREAIASRLGSAIAFTQAALLVPNQYLWGGTVAPFYDCSGLMQAAFGSQGIWLPRDAYQQEAFLEPVALDRERLEAGDWQDLQPGDLVFFGTPQKATHVGLYLGEGRYTHSSGRDMGRNGIGVDVLSGQATVPEVSQRYFQQFRGAGRVMASYVPEAYRISEA